MLINGTHFRISTDIGRQSALSRDIALDQARISSGKKILKPSDFPNAAARLAEIERHQSNLTVWQSNVDTAIAISDRADSTLESVSTILDRARELIITARSAVPNAADRATIANELRGLISEVTSHQNEKDSHGQSLFPDTNTLAIPVGLNMTIAPTQTQQSIFASISTQSGTQSVAAILNAAADAAVILDPAARATALGVSVSDIADATTHVASERGELGVRASRLERIKVELATSSSTTDIERSSLEDTDVAKTVAELQAKLLTLEAARGAFTRINQRTLFDMLG
jgi:flagellar hook-associated protein 3 FlgL